MKLKLFDPRPDTEPIEAYAVGVSDRKQCPNRTEGGCMAANGEECSIAAGLNDSPKTQLTLNNWEV